MKTSKLIATTILLMVFLFPTIVINAQQFNSVENFTGSISIKAAETLLLQLYVDKGSYNVGEDILFSGLLSMNSYPIVGVQVCVNLQFGSGLPDWGACMISDADGRIYETLVYGDIIPTGYSGTLVLSATGVYEGLTTTSETYIPYGTGWEPPDDDDDDGEVTISVYPLDKPEFSVGDSPTIAIDVMVDGVGLAGADIYAEVRLDDGTLIASPDEFADADGHFNFYLEYGTTIPVGYSGTLTVWAKAFYNDLIIDDTIYIPYNPLSEEIPLELELWGPSIPIQIGGWEVLQFGGTVTSYGNLVDGATVTMVVAGGTYQTTTGASEPGKFFYGWQNDAFPAGEYIVQVTVSKPGYLSVSGTVSFTLFGGNYDFAVVMDPIQTIYEPDINVPFPGILTLGGNPISDWIETDVTYPDGSVETFINQTEADGRFTRILPSIMEPGQYQLVVYYSGDRKQISPVYSFSVGEAKVTVEPPKVDDPTDGESEWKIINVTYPKVVTLGDTIILTGTLVTGEGENQVPLPDIPIELGVGEAGWGLDESWDTTSGEDGSFSFSVTLTSILYNELTIIAKDDEGQDGAFYYGAIETIMAVNLQVSTDKGSYETGEKVTGMVEIRPDFETSNRWDDSLNILIQIIGPTGSNEQTYTLGFKFYKADNSGFVHYGNQIDFWWVVPEGAEDGNYRVEVIVTGGDITRAEGSTTFSVEEAHRTNFYAFFSNQAPGYDLYKTTFDHYYPGRVYGKYTDHEGIAIDKADIRIIAVNTDKRSQKLELKTITDKAGEFNLTLEDLNCLGGSQRIMWELSVYADKEGYSTGADVLFVDTPVAWPRLEIIEADPLTNDLELQSFSGRINYTEKKPYAIRLKVKYTACEEGTDLWVNTRGDWALIPEKVTVTDNGLVDCNNSTWKQSVSINGNSAESIGFHDLWDSSPWTNASWTADIWLGARHDSLIALDQGIGKEVEVTLSGDLFNFRRVDDNPSDDPESCVVNMPKEGPATIPPNFGARVNLGSRGVEIRMAMVTPKEKPLLEENSQNTSVFSHNTGIDYPISNDLGLGNLNVSGTAYVGVGGGNVQATVKHGIDTILPNTTVQLQPMIRMDDPTASEPYVPTDLIKVPSSVKTDEKGHFSIPLEFVGDPCDYMDKSFVIKVSVDGFETAQQDYIYVSLRCVENIEFKLSPDGIHVVQAPDLSQEEPIRLASAKETGVRAYIVVDGDFMQPVNSPVNFNVKFELLPDGSKVPLYTQVKTVSLSEKGARVRWADNRSAVGQTGIGNVLKWENDTGKTLGSKVVPIDFAFTPYTFGGNETNYTIRITVDDEQVYGEKVEAEKEPIAVKKMKKLQFLFVPVQRPYTIFNMDYKSLYKHLKFITDAYPLTPGDIGWAVAPNFEWDDEIRLTGHGDKYTYLGRLALALGDKYGNGGGSNTEYRVVGVVAEDVWTQDTFGVSSEATGAQFGNGVTMIRYPKAPYNTLGHEIGHTLGLYFTTWLDKVQLKSKEQYLLYPNDGIKVTGLIFRNGKIFDVDGNTSASAEWRGAFEGGGSVDVFDMMGSPERYPSGDPNSLTDDYYQAPWVIPSTYVDLFEALKDPPGERILNIRGGMDDENMMWLDVLSASTGHPDPIAEGGQYQLSILDSGGETLYSTAFDIKFGEPGGVPIFSIAAPALPGMERLFIEQDGQMLAGATRSANAPTISIIEQPQSNMNENSISWQGDDLDRDLLRYELGYRCDAEGFWHPIGSTSEESHYMIDTTWLPGGENCQVKITASDGFNSAEAVTDSFQVALKVPKVEIYNQDGEVYPAEEDITLIGMALDLEDGSIPEDSIFWTSHLDGDLGTGSTLQTGLSTGKHLITLYAVDTNNYISSAEVTITIGETNAVDNGEDSDEVEDGVVDSVDDADNRRTILIIGLVILAIIMLVGAGLLLWFALNRMKESKSSQPQRINRSHPSSGQQHMTQDAQGRWWYQDPTTGARSFWNGSAWVQTSQAPTPAAPPVMNQAPYQTPKAAKPRGGSSCIFTLIIAAVLGVVVVGVISLVAFDILPFGEIQPGEGNFINILKMAGGGLLVTVLGGFLINGGLKAIITRRAVVEDDWGHRREKRGFSAVFNGLGSLFFGIICLIGGLGMMSLAVFQEVLPWLGF